MTLSMSNVAAYSIQLAVLVAMALAATTLLRLRNPRASLRFWQVAFAAAVILPLVQPAAKETGRMLESSGAFFTSSSPVAALATRGVDAAQWMLVAVAAGIVLRLLWLGIGFIRLRGIIATAAPDTSLDAIASELSTTLGTHARLTITDEIETPATVGIGRAIVLLPRRVLALPPAVQRAVIAHELMHVKRRDWLPTLAEEFWCAMLWFHPAARLVAERLALARETVVDEATILLTRDRRAYAEALLAFSNPQPHLPGVTALVGRRHLSQRIALIAEEEVMSRHRTLLCAALAFTLSGGAAVAAVTTFPMTRGTVQKTTVYTVGDDVTLPVVAHEVKPDYTPEAMQEKIQGNVILRIVVLDSGDVGEVHVEHSLDAEYGLDRQAVLAAKQWRFKPGMKDGKPVAVQVHVQMTFKLK
jgi:TonB family protein